MFKHALALPQPHIIWILNNTFLSFSLVFIARLRPPGEERGGVALHFLPTQLTYLNTGPLLINQYSS